MLTQDDLKQIQQLLNDSLEGSLKSIRADLEISKSQIRIVVGQQVLINQSVRELSEKYSALNDKLNDLKLKSQKEFKYMHQEFTHMHEEFEYSNREFRYIHQEFRYMHSQF